MMGDNPQGLRVAIPPAPTKGADVLTWAAGLVKWLGREMPSFGYGLSSSYQPNRMVKASSSASSASHPFKFRDISTTETPYTFTVSPGQFLARGRTGANSDFPEVGTAGSGVYLQDDPAPTFTVGAGKDGYVVLKAAYTLTGGKAVWSASTIYVEEVAEDATLTLPNDYLSGYLALMRVRRGTGTRVELRNTYVRSNVSHTKCNTHHHFWGFE